jgi:hypothetical protein
MHDLEILAANSDAVYAKYLQSVDTLPARVVDLAKQITATAANDYDKTKAIEQYLAKSYPYTLDPGITPKSKDFVDYFLFEQKQGYCSYYASAMTMMLRSVGIPARYVEGYMLPPSPEKGTEYYVTNQQAHAWVEVYFEGYGWLTFEPTAPFISNYYVNDEVSGSVGSGMAGNPAYEDYMKMMEQYRNSGKKPALSEEEFVLADHKSYTNIILLSFAALVMIGFISIIAFNYLKSKYRLLRVIKMDPRDGVLFLYKYYLTLLSLQGMGMHAGETPSQYAERISGNVHFRYTTNKTITFKSVTDVFVLARFSTLNISVKDKEAVYQFYERLLLKTKYSLGNLKFFLYRYILGIV